MAECCTIGRQILQVNPQEVPRPRTQTAGDVGGYISDIEYNGKTIGLEVVAGDVGHAWERLLKLEEVLRQRVAWLSIRPIVGTNGQPY